MTDDDRRQRYAQVLGAPRWNHASAHCVCERDDPDGRGLVTTMCRRNHDRAVRERDQRLDALLALVDAEVVAASPRTRRLPSLVTTHAGWRRPTLTRLRLPRTGLPGLRLSGPVARLRLTPALPSTRG